MKTELCVVSGVDTDLELAIQELEPLEAPNDVPWKEIALVSGGFATGLLVSILVLT